jgi:aldehyde dehydrogenase (NAD+)
MADTTDFYIDGKWVKPAGNARLHDVINPATEKPVGKISLGTKQDVDLAVAAARRAFPAFSATSAAERIALFDRIIAVFEARDDDLARTITMEMGSPITASHEVQTKNAVTNFYELRKVLETYSFETVMNGALLRRESIGVCGLITPWNWPLNQLTSKLSAALAAGCTVVVKPSEFSALSALLLAEVLDEAGVPAGVFNLVNGDGPTVGEAITSHPGIDMVSFTGSTRAGILVAKSAADTVKRVAQELGGKSANIILPDADIENAVAAGVKRCFGNCGQSCQAPTRMLIHRSQRDRALAVAEATARSMIIGDPTNPKTTLGPLANKNQFEKVQSMIAKGIEEGATLVAGGVGKPEGFEVGYFVRPTVFADVTGKMTIAREEIFGPVLSMMNYDTDDEAVEIANGTSYGLSGYVQSGDFERARHIASRLRAGRIYINGAPTARSLPFGGYKQSGNGREQGVFGLEEYLEVKAVLGYRSA